jgi:hypothetical protein
MPFVQQTPRSFTQQYVEVLKPNQIGVYGLFKQNVWVYIGKGDIRQRLLAHLNGDNTRIVAYAPTYWVDELTDGDPSNRERQLIVECQPICNQRVG